MSDTQERYQTFTDLLQEIRRLNDLSDAKRAEAVSRGEAYNLFEVLGASTSELAHSAFIANLLTPHATHGLGFRPLQSFLEVIGESQWSENDIKLGCSEFAIIAIISVTSKS